MDALEFLARVASHIPDKRQVVQRSYGWYASRTRGTRRQAGTAEQPFVCAEPVPVPLREARRRWAELLRRVFEVEPLECPRCGQTVRTVIFITEPAIDRILDDVRRAATARRRSRAPPWMGGVRSGTAGVPSSHWLDASSTKGDT